MTESFCFKFVKCLTCGLWPRFLTWFYAKINYERWSLSLQMVASVFCSMVFVFAAVGWIIIESTNYMENNMYKAMDENYLSPKEEENFMQIAANVAE